MTPRVNLKTVYGPCPTETLVGGHLSDLWLRDYSQEPSIVKCTTVLRNDPLNSCETRWAEPSHADQRGPGTRYSGKETPRTKRGKGHYLVSVVMLICGWGHSGGSLSSLESHQNPVCYVFIRIISSILFVCRHMLTFPNTTWLVPHRPKYGHSRHVSVS